ncbi:hypothetical protein C0V72_12450 [Porphyrobacter sp. TH134]|nr:hypothetical protein C0V72_12450 [Porphyrobacter sp. TH134]
MPNGGLGLGPAPTAEQPGNPPPPSTQRLRALELHKLAADQQTVRAGSQAGKVCFGQVEIVGDEVDNCGGFRLKQHRCRSGERLRQDAQGRALASRCAKIDQRVSLDRIERGTAPRAVLC